MEWRSLVRTFIEERISLGKGSEEAEISLSLSFGLVCARSRFSLFFSFSLARLSPSLFISTHFFSSRHRPVISLSSYPPAPLAQYRFYLSAE